MIDSRFVVAVFSAIVLMLSLSLVVLFLTYFERKALARIQQRKGPTRVGYMGILQPFADAVKLITKEDIIPARSDKAVYWIAPVAVFIPAFVIWVTIPVARGVVLENLDLGLFYIVAVSVFSVLGLLLAGWGSANKWAVIGGLRAAGQLVSYEIPFIMSILAIAVLGQTLNLRTIVESQSQFAYGLFQPLGLFIFFTSGLAELGRTPFDIHHAESEVVGGPFVEYSGAHWAVFFLTEYVNTFTVAVLTVLLFLGGWNWPTMPFEGLAHTVLSMMWLLLKTVIVIWLIFWIRGTYPRIRIDQLMTFSWKFLVPLSFINVVLTACVVFYGLSLWFLSVLSVLILSGGFWLMKKSAGLGSEYNTVTIVSSRELMENVQPIHVADKDVS